jgi:Phosphopantetheine attachment site
MSQEPSGPPIGEQVLAVMRDVIGNPDLTPADDYYLAGGHSLLIVRIVRRLRRVHHIELDARQFAVNSQLAALMAAARPVAADTADPAPSRQ